MNKTRFSKRFLAMPAAGLICVLSLISAWARQGVAFLYKANAPLWPGHGPQAPLFSVKAAVVPLQDLTVDEEAYEPALAAAQKRLNLAQNGADRWPLLSAEVLSRALAQELSQDGLASSASVEQDEWAARAAGERLLVTGELEEASVTSGSDGISRGDGKQDDAGGESGGPTVLTLRLELRVLAQGADSGEFDWAILDKEYKETQSLAAAPDQSLVVAAWNYVRERSELSPAPGQDEEKAAQAATSRLFAQAARDIAAVLQDPELQKKLGW